MRTEKTSTRVQRSALMIGAFAVAGLIAGCGGSSTTTDNSSNSNGSSTKSVDGKQVFADAGCGGCHTLDAAGSKGQSGPVLNDVKLSETAVAGKVRSGGGGMPAFGGKLSDAEITAVASFVAGNDGSESAPK